MSEPDPIVGDLRAEISRSDRAALDALNRRLELVAELKRHKAERGIAFLDPEREEAMLEDFVRANAGPLSDDGARELLRFLLALTKRELEG